MVKNVTVTVVGEQRTSREENNVEPIELVTRGSLHEKDGVFYLKYDEYYEDLEKPARNLLKFDKEGRSQCCHVVQIGRDQRGILFYSGWYDEYKHTH